jgi:hypothetical protein
MQVEKAISLYINAATGTEWGGFLLQNVATATGTEKGAESFLNTTIGTVKITETQLQW